MQVHFETGSRDATSLRDMAVLRVRFVMRRMAWIVPRAHVRMTDLNGPRGGVDKQCRVELVAPGNGKVVVTAVARDWRSALDTALARAAHALRRQWQRVRSPVRRSPRALEVPRRSATAADTL